MHEAGGVYAVASVYRLDFHIHMRSARSQCGYNCVCDHLICISKFN